MDYRTQLVTFSHILEQKGFVNGLEGNISIFDREASRIYITPSQHMKLLLDESGVCVLDEAGNQLEGRFPRTSEFFLHQAIYRGCPDVNAVIHSHCPYLTAYALAGRDFIIPETSPFHKVFSRFVCLPYGKSGTHDIHRGIEKALSDSPICLLGCHGVVCAAKNLEDATGYLEAVEGFAKTRYLAQHLPE